MDNALISERHWRQTSGAGATGGFYLPALPMSSPIAARREFSDGGATGGYPVPICSLSSADDMWAARPESLLSAAGAGLLSRPSPWHSSPYSHANALVSGNTHGDCHQEPPSVITFFTDFSGDDDVSVLHEDPDHDDQTILPQTTVDVLLNLFEGMDESDDDGAAAGATRTEPDRSDEHVNIWSYDKDRNYEDSRNDWRRGA